VSSNNGALLKDRMDNATVRRTRLQFGGGCLIYVPTLALSFVSAPLTLGGRSLGCDVGPACQSTRAW